MKNQEQCKECGSGYEVKVREFCSEKYMKENIQKHISDATEKESSHISRIYQKIRIGNYSILEIS